MPVTSAPAPASAVQLPQYGAVAVSGATSRWRLQEAMPALPPGPVGLSVTLNTTLTAGLAVVTVAPVPGLLNAVAGAVLS